ncbi:MAG TPA: hypothetical protein VK213_06530 [Bacteroidales bacterium]|nr:hypothetical protein [Bacteroidales bacterium]
MKKLKLFIHVSNSQKYTTAEVDDDLLISQLIKENSQAGISEEVDAYLEDQEEGLDKKITVSKADLKNGDHVFLGRCKKVSVSINYAGKSFPLSVSPATSMKKLKKEALKYFGIDEVSGADLLLWYNNEPLDMRQIIGSLTEFPTCSVSLVLATKNDVNG